MWLWVMIIVSGACAFLSFYMAILVHKTGGDGVFLFGGFGLLFIIPFILTVIKAASKRSRLLKRVDEMISGEPRAAFSVPHWFVMSALLVFGLIILAVMLVSS